MGVFAGPADWWTEDTDSGRQHIATKGVVQNGLVLNLDAGVDSSYLGSGTNWADLSGQNNDGTLVNGVGYSSDNGGLLIFDGVNDHINGVHNDQTNITGDITIECWFKLSNTRNDWVRIFGKGDGSNRTVGLWYNQLGGSFLYQRYGTTSMGAQYIATVALDTWYHMVGTSSSNNHTLYLNNVVRAQSSTGTTFYSSTDPYKVGYGSIHTYHVGSVSNCRLYNRALTSQEIQQNFNALRGRFDI